MREMKDSGVEWIEKIPLDWQVRKIKHLATLAGRIGWQGLTSNEYEDEGAYLITGINFNNGKIDWESCVHVSEQRWEEASQIQIKNGDLLITKDGTIGKVAIVENMPGKTSLNSGVLLVRNSEECNTRFLYWVMQSEVFWKWFGIINAGNSTILHLYQQSFYNFSFPFPILSQQVKIADYLDVKCSKIDEIIKKQQAIIEKLKEYKLSIITEAVTEGINFDVKMKDSNIDMCEQIPEHWNVSQNRYLFSLRDEKNYKPLEEVRLLSLYTDLGVFPHGEQEERGNKAVKAEGYKVVYEDDIVVNIILAWMGAIGRSAYDGVTSPAYDIYKPNENVCSRYYHYLYRTKPFSAECYKYGRGIMAMRWRTYSSEFKSIKVPVPPYVEQCQIADYLDRKCELLDKTIADRNKAIDKLQGYKKSLIYEVVTGKKEV